MIRAPQHWAGGSGALPNPESRSTVSCGVPRSAASHLFGLLALCAPLAFGQSAHYVVSASTQEDGPAFAWEAVDSHSFEVPLRADDDSIAVGMPFQFRFGGSLRTTLRVSTNGYATFGDYGDEFQTLRIPDPGRPDDFLAPFWDDVDMRVAGQLYVALKGVAPRRKFVVTWLQVQLLQVFDGDLTFQLVLEEGTNAIVFQYLMLSGLRHSGQTAAIGLEYGDRGVQWAYRQAGSAFDGLAIRFTPVSDMAGDMDGNGIVSLVELNRSIAAFRGLGPADSSADTNGDGVLSLRELNAVLTAFNKG